MRTIATALLLVTALTATAAAQAQIVPKDEIKGAGKEDLPELNPWLGLTATVSLISNSNVIGQVDGFSTLIGLGVIGGLDYINGRHVLRSNISISESLARTPVIDELVKTNDVVKVETIYNYFVSKNLGGFGRLSVQTAAFPADDVRGVETSWVEKPANPGDPPIPLETNSLRQRLADPLTPFTLNESVGLFAEPVRKEKINLSLRLGVGGRHTFADSVLLIDDDGATPEVELLRLTDVHQLGAEAFAGAIGKLKGGKVNYRVGFSVLIPFVNNDDFDRSATDLTRVGLESAVSFGVFDWMSIVYSLNVTRDPQIFPAGNELTQVQNNLLLTFSYTLVKKKEASKEPTDAEKELAAAKARADECERARDAAEQRARDLEQKLNEAAPPATTPAPTPAPAPAPDATPAPAPTPP